MTTNERRELAKELIKVKRIHYQSITARYPLQVVQIDLTDMSPFHNNRAADGRSQPRYILTAIDIYSRFAQAEFVKHKTTTECLEAFKKILERFASAAGKSVLTYYPRKVQSDDGSEFKGVFHAYLLKLGIEHIIFNKSSKHKSFHNEMSIVERFHRTMKHKTQLDFIENDNFDYLNHLQNNIIEYNNDYHSTIKSIPSIVYVGDDEPDEDYVNRVPMTLKPGTSVRIRRKKGKFDKRTLSTRWSDELYTIESNNGLSYKLEGIDDERFTVNEILESQFQKPSGGKVERNEIANKTRARVARATAPLRDSDGKLPTVIPGKTRRQSERLKLKRQLAGKPVVKKNVSMRSNGIALKRSLPPLSKTTRSGRQY